MYHKPALLKESLTGLEIQANGIYVDVTFGGGGHSKAILEELNQEGKLFAFDQDPDAAANAIDDKRFSLIQQNFSYLKNYLRMHNAIPVDGLLADLGVSFHQFDVPKRGFSFRFDGPLDMRMSQAGNLTAEKVVNSYSLDDLANLLKRYGEINNSNQVANWIVEARKESPIKDIQTFRSIFSARIPQAHEHKFLAQVFQAIRIEVNQELKVIEQLLEQAVEVLNEGGRIAVITYHSLEDRLVKNFFRSGNFEGKVVKDFYGNVLRPLEPINRKPIVAQFDEVKSNNRSRSAKLRVAKKLANAE